jgi:hypothetical protein
LHRQLSHLRQTQRKRDRFANYEFSIGGKWLEMLMGAAPSIKRLQVILSPENAGGAGLQQAINATAPALGVQRVATLLARWDWHNRTEQTVRLIVGAGSEIDCVRARFCATAECERPQSVYHERLAARISKLSDEFATRIERVHATISEVAD